MGWEWRVNWAGKEKEGWENRREWKPGGKEGKLEWNGEEMGGEG